MSIAMLGVPPNERGQTKDHVETIPDPGRQLGDDVTSTRFCHMQKGERMGRFIICTSGSDCMSGTRVGSADPPFRRNGKQ
ncbi:hypothetical protein B0I35DRAFT_438051 [Stachybotrys elegans]|uniref:Uncharacterized protein n=1 Tax=Stachybotrys elegans TaxID=80388 RepID=A0A8K0WP32_9HYPO|nr:hypothetical protein B0I35DRAFT_438051 [Stachybotrys elegans]